MSKPGPKPGWKKAAAASAAAPAATTQAPQQPLPPVLAVVAPIVAPEPEQPAPIVLSAADRENPDKLTGDALRALAHRRGLARSAIERLSDEKIRTEMRYLTYRQYEAA